MSDQGINVESLDEVLRRVQELERQRTYRDPDEIRRLQLAVIEGLKEFEYSLRRDLQGEGEDRLLLSWSDDVPAGFRELVEEYYRELSNKNR